MTKNHVDKNVFCRLNIVLFVILCIMVLRNVLSETGRIPMSNGGSVYQEYTRATMYKGNKIYELRSDAEVYIIRRIAASTISGQRLFITGKFIWGIKKNDSKAYYYTCYNDADEKIAEIILDNRKRKYYMHLIGKGYYRSDYSPEFTISQNLSRQIEKGTIEIYVSKHFK